MEKRESWEGRGGCWEGRREGRGENREGREEREERRCEDLPHMVEGGSFFFGMEEFAPFTKKKKKKQNSKKTVGRRNQFFGHKFISITYKLSI